MDPSVLLLSITSDNPAKNPKERSFERPLGLWKDLTFVRPIAQFSLSQREHYQHDCRHAQHKADHARQPRYTADAHRVKALKRGDRIRKRDKRQSRNKLTGMRSELSPPKNALITNPMPPRKTRRYSAVLNRLSSLIYCSVFSAQSAQHTSNERVRTFDIIFICMNG